MNYFPEEKRQKRSEKIMHKIKTLARNEQLGCQKKLDSPSALCSKEMALEILRKAVKIYCQLTLSEGVSYEYYRA